MGEMRHDIDTLCSLIKALQEHTQTLYEIYGIKLCTKVSTNIANKHSIPTMEVQLMNGVDEVADAICRTPKETDEWILRKDFKYRGIAFCQLAERNSREYKGLKKGD